MAALPLRAPTNFGRRAALRLHHHAAKTRSRMASWFAYCDKYSRDKCHTAPYQVHGVVENPKLLPS